MVIRKILLMFALLLLSTLISKVSAQFLTLHHADGTTTDVELYIQPRVEFTASKLLLTSPVLSMEYDVKDILRITYKGVPTEIFTPQDDAGYMLDSDRLVFHHVKDVRNIAVYTLNGIRVPVSIAHNADEASLSIASLPKGTYLLKANGRTSKVQKP